MCTMATMNFLLCFIIGLSVFSLEGLAENAAYNKLRSQPLQIVTPTRSEERNQMKETKFSPVALYVLKQLVFGSNSARSARADKIIGINNTDNSLPWVDDCSGGYDHCGGYFPLCCEGFICLKPLTPWDKKHGFNRCWPHYFQDDDDGGEE